MKMLSSCKIKNIILTKYFQYFSAATRWPHCLNMSSSHMKQKLKTDIAAVLQRLENNEVSTLLIKIHLTFQQDDMVT